MESVDVFFSKPNVEDVTPNDIEKGYYCPRLVDHLELRPLEISTSSSLEIETRLAIIGGVEALHDVGPLLLSPFTKLGISQESAKTSGLANYRFQEIASTFSFSNEAPHSKLVLQKIPKILNLVNVNWQDDATILGFTKGDVQEMT